MSAGGDAPAAYSRYELAGLPGMPGTPKGVAQRARREGWRSRRRAGRGGGLAYLAADLPAETQRALAARPAGEAESTQAEAAAARPAPARPAPEALWAEYERRPERHQRLGRERAALLQQALALAAAEGCGQREAFRRAGEAQGIAWRTLERWWHGDAARPGARRYDRADWPAALVPQYRGGRGGAACDEAAWEWLRADYLRPEAPAVTACYERLQRVAAERGWQVPSLRTLQRRLQREVPRAVRVLAREGADALKACYPAQERDHSTFHALEAVNADGHKFDVFVAWPDGAVARPIMVAWQDVYSGLLLAWRIDRTENADSVRLSFGDVVERYGIPEHAYLDNGRGFAAKHITGGAPNRFRFRVRPEDPVGILKGMGVEPHWTTPYSGQSKPIERAFRDLCEHIGRHPRCAGAYTGNKPTAKPESYGQAAVPLAEFVALVETEIGAHNTRPGRRSPTCAGRSLAETFDESYRQAPIRRATAQQRRLYLLRAEGVRVRRDGTLVLRVDGDNRYHHEALVDHAGEQVAVRFDPDHLHDPVHVYSTDGRYLCAAACVLPAGFADSQAAREHARQRRQYVRAAKQQLDNQRRMSALELARQLPAGAPAAPPDAHVVRMFRPAAELVDPPPATRSAAELAALREAAEVVALEPRDEPSPVQMSDAERWQYWCELDARLASGEPVSESARAWHQQWQQSPFFQSYREHLDEQEAG